MGSQDNEGLIHRHSFAPPLPSTGLRQKRKFTQGKINSGVCSQGLLHPSRVTVEQQETSSTDSRKKWAEPNVEPKSAAQRQKRSKPQAQGTRDLRMWCSWQGPQPGHPETTTEGPCISEPHPNHSTMQEEKGRSEMKIAQAATRPYSLGPYTFSSQAQPLKTLGVHIRASSLA